MCSRKESNRRRKELGEKPFQLICKHHLKILMDIWSKSKRYKSGGYWRCRICTRNQKREYESQEHRKIIKRESSAKYSKSEKGRATAKKHREIKKERRPILTRIRSNEVRRIKGLKPFQTPCVNRCPGLKDKWNKQGAWSCRNCEKIKNAKLYKKDKKRITERNKQYKNKNIEKYKNRQKNYRLKNKEKLSLQRKKYYNENKNKILNKGRKHRQDNPEYYYELTAYHRNLRRNATPVNVNRAELIIIYKKAKELFSHKVHVDHILPIMKGGLHVPENLQIIPEKYNLEKNVKLPHPDIVKNLDKIFEEKYGYCRLK